MTQPVYDSDKPGDPQTRIFVDPDGGVAYEVNGARVMREDFAMIVDAQRLYCAQRTEAEVERLADYLQQLDPDVEDTFGRMLRDKLQLIAEVTER
jgi:hypothetical protein